jgi:hypothetical protein
MEIQELECWKCNNQILMLPPKAITILSCGHTFHRLCIEKNLIHNKTNICHYQIVENVISEGFVLSSPPIRMEGIEDTATQRAKSYLRCAKCSEDLFMSSSSNNAPTKPLVYLTCKHIVHYDCIENPRKLCHICPSVEDLELFPVEQASRTAQKKRSREDSNESSASTSGRSLRSLLIGIIPLHFKTN